MNKMSKLYILLLLSVSLILSTGCIISYASDNYYDSYEQLSEHEVLNEDYAINYKQRYSNIAIIAIHGGSIEPGTSEAAKGLAEQMRYSYYLFEGIKPSNNQILHLTSVSFDEPIGRKMAQDSMTVLSIHGYRGEESIVFLSGKNETFKKMIGHSLRKRGFRIEEAPSDIGGTNDENIVNDNQLKAGVQLELTAELRKSFFENHDWSQQNRSNTTAIYYRFIDGLKAASYSYDTVLSFGEANEESAYNK
ncbi:replication protein [Peribacillus cavernae]|uniref:Replication protein n=1 Tax=Peribacillus cavernae TaxID=1674310 RepID=A0A433HG24_9BACI|nr:poly-gamma-glutamate hydrolase family protein [Peribacillus cavernae]MDQ0219813.1 phage replication-related protein YjqB (UPF0714/DUF867 family) [Peribacillus cavernae]RUQ27205.1 replication protein [Peribacillus cavernae]